MRQGKEHKNEYRNTLTSVMSRYSVIGVARFKDIVEGIKRQTARKNAELIKDADELASLRESYQRYRELSQQMESKEHSVKIGFSLLLNAPIKVNSDADAYTTPEYVEEMHEAAGVTIGHDDLELSNFPLWQVIREIVRQTAEIRVFELGAHLKSFGLSASRPAIESALATHPKEFRIVKRGREKFVSLKGA